MPKEKREGKTYLNEFKVYISGYDASPHKIEWMRYENDLPLPKLVKTVQHIAFEVEDLMKALKGKEILIETNSQPPGVIVAFIVDNGAQVELL